MPRYTLTRPLPSSQTGHALLVELEDYLRRHARDSTARGDQAPEREIELVVRDRWGQATYPGVAALGSLLLPDDTEGVILRYGNAYQGDLYIGISLGRTRWNTEVQVSCAGDASQELAHGIARGVADRVRKHGTWHWLAHPTALGAMMLVGVLAAFVAVSHYAFPSQGTFSWPMVLLYFSGGALVGTFPVSLYPYTTFEAKSDQHAFARRAVAWLVGGSVIGVLGNLAYSLWPR